MSSNSKKQNSKNKSSTKPLTSSVSVPAPKVQEQPKVVAKQLTNHDSRKTKPKRITGKGDYNIKDAYNDVFDNDTPSEGFVNKGVRKVGEVVGNTFGFGRELGNAASKLARIFGFGDYTISNKYNIRKNSFTGNSPPTFSSGKGEDVIIVKREKVCDLVSKGFAFSSKKFFLNPGNPEVFKYLSPIAKGFEEYQWLGLVFEFKSSASDTSASGGGIPMVIIATDYDCLDENFDTKDAMEASEFSDSVKASQNVLHPVECDPKRNVMERFYVLPGITNVNQINANGAAAFSDPRFDTLGQTYVASSGGDASTNGTVLGEVWVSYKVKLSRPTLESGVATSAVVQTFHGIVNSTGVFVTPGGNPLVSRIKGGVGFSANSVQGSGSTTGLKARLLYDGPMRGYFIIHVTSRVNTSLSCAWYPHTSEGITSNGAWSYDPSLLKDDISFGPIDNQYFTTGYNANANTSSYKSYNSTYVGYCLPTNWNGIGTISFIDVPVFVNNTTNSFYSITIMGIGDPLLAGSRTRTLMYNNLSTRATNGTVETSDYLLDKSGVEFVSLSKDEDTSTGSETPQVIEQEDFSDYLAWKKRHEK